MSKILNSLNLSNATKQAAVIDKTALRREKLVNNLLEQCEIAKAVVAGKEYVATHMVVVVN